jgi:hypothetical protein
MYDSFWDLYAFTLNELRVNTTYLELLSAIAFFL